MTYYLDPAKNTYSYNLSVAHEMCAAEQFATKQAHKDCLTRIQRAYECLRDKRDLKALEAAGFNWFDIPMELRHCRHEKHFDLFCAALGNDDAGRVFYLQREQQRIKAMPVVKPTPSSLRLLHKRLKNLHQPKAAAPKTERSATHVGSCQICGRKHKVDVKTGRIASHGYHKNFGFHSNQCFGTYSFPYETHTDRLEEWLDKMRLVLQRSVSQYHTAKEQGDNAAAAKHSTYSATVRHNIEQTITRIAAHKPNQPLTPVEELV